MAGATLLTLLDDIATILDDIAVLSKVAAKKTAGVLGDDLALNAQQVSGVSAERELPVVWAVAKGSAKNKLILVPLAIAISAVAPWGILPLLMIGGIYLCYEGFEKIAHALSHSRTSNDAEHAKMIQALADSRIDLVEFEKEKIKGAIRTDFILSAEIIVIALGTVSTATLITQFTVVSSIAAVMTVGVYGLVAGIVKLDDVGLYLLKSGSDSAIKRIIGRSLLRAAPVLMKTLSVVGTLAMFIVGGGIIVHGIPGLHETLHQFALAVSNMPAVATILSEIANVAIGLVAGMLTLIIAKIVKSMLRK